jgi:uncharacterized protein YeaO (DUF488 family)
MLREASISQMKSMQIPKENRVLVNRGRGNDELAPSDELFALYHSTREKLEPSLGKGSEEAHNQAFLDMRYEKRFREQILEDPSAMARLEELSRLAESEDIYLVCYEGPRKACHRRILMRIAEETFKARIDIEGVEPKNLD